MKTSRFLEGGRDVERIRTGITFLRSADADLRTSPVCQVEESPTMAAAAVTRGAVTLLESANIVLSLVRSRDLNRGP